MLLLPSFPLPGALPPFRQGGLGVSHRYIVAHSKIKEENEEGLKQRTRCEERHKWQITKQREGATKWVEAVAFRPI